GGAIVAYRSRVEVRLGACRHSSGHYTAPDRSCTPTMARIGAGCQDPFPAAAAYGDYRGPMSRTGSWHGRSGWLCKDSFLTWRTYGLCTRSGGQRRVMSPATSLPQPTQDGQSEG